MRQFFTQHSYNRQTQQQRLQQQKMTYLQTQKSYRGQAVYDFFINSRQRNAMQNVGPIVIAPSPEIIDLLSSPSSPVPPTVQATPVLPNISWELTRIPERMWALDTSNNDAYKVNNDV